MGRAKIGVEMKESGERGRDGLLELMKLYNFFTTI